MMVAYCLVSFEEHYPTTLVASSEIVSSMVKLNCRDDIGCKGREAAVSMLGWRANFEVEMG
jgi:hypothetical protein